MSRFVLSRHLKQSRETLHAFRKNSPIKESGLRLSCASGHLEVVLVGGNFRPGSQGYFDHKNYIWRALWHITYSAAEDVFLHNFRCAAGHAPKRVVDNETVVEIALLAVADTPSINLALLFGAVDKHTGVAHPDQTTG